MSAKKTKKAQTQAKKTSPAKKPVVQKTVKIAKTPVKKTVKPATQELKVAKEVIAPKELKPKQLLWPIIILLIALAMLFLKDQLIVAMVNGKPITRFQVIKELENQGASQILDSLVTMEIVKQEINKLDIKVSDEEIDTQLNEIEESLSAQGQSLDDLLAMQGVSREDIKKDLKLNLQIDKVLADKIQASEEEVLEYFESNKELLGDGVNFAEIKEDIEAQLIQEKRATAQQEWLTAIRDEAQVRYFRFEPSSLF